MDSRVDPPTARTIRMVKVGSLTLYTCINMYDGCSLITQRCHRADPRPIASRRRSFVRVRWRNSRNKKKRGEIDEGSKRNSLAMSTERRRGKENWKTCVSVFATDRSPGREFKFRAILPIRRGGMRSCYGAEFCLSPLLWISRKISFNFLTNPKTVGQ